MPFISGGLSGIIVLIPAILIAITFHEYAHGKVAFLFGDPTPQLQGRLTLNPIKHLDPIGTILLFIAGFGWAKPVQVNPANFKGDKRKTMMYVGLAGPAMNLVLAYLAAVGMQITGGLNIGIAGSLYLFFNLLLFYNVILAIFNLIPIPPLDGSKILAGLVPLRYVSYIQKIEQYGPIILLILIFTGAISFILGKPVQVVRDFFISLSGISFF